MKNVAFTNVREAWHLRQDLYEKAGLEGERIVFLLTDTQIIHEDFLEVP